MLIVLFVFVQTLLEGCKSDGLARIHIALPALFDSRRHQKIGLYGFHWPSLVYINDTKGEDIRTLGGTSHYLMSSLSFLHLEALIRISGFRPSHNQSIKPERHNRAGLSSITLESDYHGFSIYTRCYGYWDSRT